MDSMKRKAKQTPPPPPSPTADSSGGGDVDRISALDDDLCELILRLAHLDVKELVRTSVLSKRWRGLWKRCPVLDFFGWPVLKSPGDVRQYITIVNDVLEQRAGATSEARVDELKIPLLLAGRMQLWTPAMKAAAMKAAEAWIRYAMHHQVKAFQLNLRLWPFSADGPCAVVDLDELLPSSPKLECLRLGLGNTEIRFPRTVMFTSLKDLALQFVDLAAGSVHLFARLLSSACCPSLQKLCMSYVYFNEAGTNELVLEASELLELSMKCLYKMEVLELRTPKLLYLEINGCKQMGSLRISAPGLKELTYFRNTAFIQGHLPCVQRLKIDLNTYMEEEDEDEEEPNGSSIYLLKLCSSSIRCLLVDLYVPPEEEGHIDLIKDNIPQLPNITSLLDEYYSDDAEGFSCNLPEQWNANDIYLARLCEAHFRGMTGTECEIRFLQFVLASAKDLQSVTVSFTLCFIEDEEVQDSRMHYFLHSLIGDGTWTTCEDEGFDNKPYEFFFEDYKPYKCSKLYKWAPSP